jgi:hypothetical protein
VHGPEILARWLAIPSVDPDKYGNHWQYNSRSDRHSVIGCWGIAFDLLAASSVLRSHVAAGKIVLGINHSLNNFAADKDKKLDLVFAKPREAVPPDAETFADLAVRFGIALTDAEEGTLAALPRLPIAPVGAVLIALEAKAAMTAHQKALPRLHDELNSSHQIVHGASRNALAIGYVVINASTQFASSVSNSFRLGTRDLIVTTHPQPKAVQIVMEMVAKIPRRSAASESGFDGMGISVVDFDNMGGDVSLVTGPPAPAPGSTFHYDSMIVRMATEFDARFANIWPVRSLRRASGGRRPPGPQGRRPPRQRPRVRPGSRRQLVRRRRRRERGRCRRRPADRRVGRRAARLRGLRRPGRRAAGRPSLAGL